jgi:hypothetical protein
MSLLLAAGSGGVTADLSATLAALTLSADGTITQPSVTADLSVTLGAVTLSSDATIASVAITADLSATLANVTLSADGTITLPVLLGGGGASAKRRGRLRGEGWGREREILELSLQQIEEQSLRQIARTLADSDRPQAQRIARKLVDYNGELEQIESLRRELAKLEVAQQERTAANLARQQYDADMQAAAAELRAVLRDDDDAIAAIHAAEAMDIRHVLGMLGMTIH